MSSVYMTVILNVYIYATNIVCLLHSLTVCTFSCSILHGCGICYLTQIHAKQREEASGAIEGRKLFLFATG